MLHLLRSARNVWSSLIQSVHTGWVELFEQSHNQRTKLWLIARLSTKKGSGWMLLHGYILFSFIRYKNNAVGRSTSTETGRTGKIEFFLSSTCSLLQVDIVHMLSSFNVFHSNFILTLFQFVLLLSVGYAWSCSVLTNEQFLQIVFPV